MIFYHDLRKMSPHKVREIVRKVLDQNQGNVFKTVRILASSRHTVRRARDRPVEDLSRKPHRSPKKTSSDFEKLIVCEAIRTGFRYRRLKAFLVRKFDLSFYAARKSSQNVRSL
jgi:hypothetical protein